MSDIRTLRILDASLNRAGEGLRVAEDYVRFVLDDPFLTGQLKGLRHDLAASSAAIQSVDRHTSRDTGHDVGTTIESESEGQRTDSWAVCAASLKRTQQSLRSLEEYGKLVDSAFARQVEALRYRLYTLEKAIDVGRLSRERLSEVKLCVLTDGRKSVEEFKQLIGQLVEAGAGIIQLRDTRLDDRELADRARRLVAIARKLSPNLSLQGRGTIVIVNDRPDIAATVHADGVHLGQEDLSLKDARAVVGPRMLIGVSTHNIEQARAAVLDGANYLGAGPTFPSQTKSFKDFAGLDYLRQVAEEIRLPTFAIGGITIGNLPEVLATGITRVAVSATVTGADKPACALREMLDMLNDPKHGR